MTAAAELPYTPALGQGGAARALRIGVTPAVKRRPALQLVAAVRTDAPRAPFVAVVVALLVAGLLGLLVLNTVLAQDAFALHTLSQDGRSLADREQGLSREVEALRSPQALAAKAGELGMVQAGPPAFLRLPDGAILGAAAPAPAAVVDPALATPANPATPDALGADAPPADAPPAQAPPADAPAADPAPDVNHDGIAGNDTVPDVNHDGIAGNDTVPDVNHDGIAGNDTAPTTVPATAGGAR